MLARDVTSADDVPGSTTRRWTDSRCAPQTPPQRPRAAAVELRLVGESRAGARTRERSAPARRSRSRRARWCRPAPTRCCASRTPSTPTGACASRPRSPAGQGDPPRRRGRPGGRAGAGRGHTARPRRARRGGVHRAWRELPCARRPRVAVVVTGDELVAPGGAARAGPDSEHERLCAAGAGARAPGRRSLEVRDGRRRLPCDGVDALRARARGGRRGGDRRRLGRVPTTTSSPALAELGVEQVFWGVALRPGQPTWFGTRGRAPSFSGCPAIRCRRWSRSTCSRGRRSHACSARLRRERRATATFDAGYAKRPGRAHVVRCTLRRTTTDGTCARRRTQGSHVLTSMLGAEALAYLEVERGDVSAGERVEIEIL